MLIKTIQEAIEDSIAVKSALLADDIIQNIKIAAVSSLKCIESGGKIMLAGNGGSAADSQHIAAEFVSKFMFDRPAMPALALTTDTSALTAIGNDYGFQHLFERQLSAFGNKGDVFIGISTSGHSENIKLAAIEAKRLGIFTIGFGGLGGEIWGDFDLVINVPSKVTARIQECHILIGHIICQLVESIKWTK